MQFAAAVRGAVTSGIGLHSVAGDACGMRALAELQVELPSSVDKTGLAQELLRCDTALCDMQSCASQAIPDDKLKGLARLFDPRGDTCGLDALTYLACVLRVASLKCDAFSAVMPDSVATEHKIAFLLESIVNAETNTHRDGSRHVLNCVKNDTLQRVMQDWFTTMATRPDSVECARELLMLSVAITQSTNIENRLVTAALDRCRDLQKRNELHVLWERRRRNPRIGCAHEGACGHGLRRAARERLTAPVPDDLYQIAMEYLIASRAAPAMWGRDLTEDALRRSALAFKRNPASNVVARVAPELANAIRGRSRSLVEGAHSDAGGALAWELGLLVLAYDCDQAARAEWLSSYFVDGDLEPEHGLERLRRFRTSSPRHAPLLLQLQGAWYLCDARSDACVRMPDAWCAMHEWCRTVLHDLHGMPRRGVDLSAHLRSVLPIQV
ncbi:hypothetical protein CYMTET_38370 [Cymbomonas tetramitiformis]|uniref:Uncharacterized protein n=1 Tax=Cymbomonas tetramitiformis TaxID=36881 RepID=A0AAE0F511_9CHLO|nr:hypothetical protein CYMTET_38370 [Cymbomonas tetramitiformis]